MIKVILIFALIGLLTSLAFGLLSAVNLLSLISTALVCALLSGGLGASIFKLLQEKVPESLDFIHSSFDSLQNIKIGKEQQEYLPSLSPSEDEAPPAFATDIQGAGISSEESNDEINTSSPSSVKSSSYGSHSLVDRIKLKNEPKIMAEAVRTMLTRDGETESKKV